MRQESRQKRGLEADVTEDSCRNHTGERTWTAKRKTTSKGRRDSIRARPRRPVRTRSRGPRTPSSGIRHSRSGMRAGPALPICICRPVRFAVAESTAPRTSWSPGSEGWLTACGADCSLGAGGHALAGVRTGLSDDLVCGVLVGVIAVGLVDARVQIVEGIAGAEVGPVVVVVVLGEVLEAGRDA